MIKKDVFQNLKSRRVYQFYLDEETMEITDITSRDDFVQVVRCKGCKFSMSGIDKYNGRYILCQLHERSYGVIDDGFCSWAERKEE